MKHIKLFEDYSAFLKGIPIESLEDHRAYDFTKEEENSIRRFASENNLNLKSIIGIGFGGIAFELDNDKILKYTYDDIEVSASGLIIGKKCEYLADIYKIYDFQGAWIIILEKLKPLDNNTIIELGKICSLYGGDISEFNFDDLNDSFSETLNKKLSIYQQKLYTDLLNIKKECYKYNFELIDCKIDNLGFKKGHLAMFDIKYTGD